MLETRTLVIDQIEVPGFGPVEVIPAINTEGCVDPRGSLPFYEQVRRFSGHSGNSATVRRGDHHVGAERSPGASVGKIMALVAAVQELPVEKAVKVVADWEQSEGRNITLHEDTYPGKLGCGHIDNAGKRENERLYGLPHGKVLKIKDTIFEGAADGALKVDVPVLHGDHNEKGVLIVISGDKTVVPTTDESQFFRFDAARYDASLDRLTRFAQRNDIPVTTEALRKAGARQRNATLGLLASGLPVFEVMPAISIPQRRVRQIGTVQPLN